MLAFVGFCGDNQHELPIPWYADADGNLPFEAGLYITVCAFFFGYALGLGHCELLAQAVGNIFLSNVKISVQKAQQKNKSVRQRDGQKFA